MRLWLLVLGACAGSHSSTLPALAIQDVTIVDAKHVGTPGMTVVVRGNTIVAVGPRASTPVPAGARVIDGRGKFVLPGLWDAHIHLVDVDEPAFPVLVAHGVTSVRDMGGDVAKLTAWRAATAAGTLVGPRIRFCGPMLEGKAADLPAGRTDHVAVPDPAAARAIVDQLAASGVDCIKLRSFANEPTYRALADAARAHHLPLVGHAPWGIDPAAAAAAGQASFEHGFYPWPWSTLGADDRDAVARAFRTHGVLVTPTLIAWQSFLVPDAAIEAAIADPTGRADPRERTVSRALRKNWVSGFVDIKKMRTPDPKSHEAWLAALDADYAELRDLHDRGVGLMVGSDTGVTLVFPGAAVHEEMKLLVDKVGLRPIDAILAATIIPAKHLGLDHVLGTIEVGKLADLVVLAADPLRDIRAIDRVETVILDGRVFDPTALVAEAERRIAR